MDEETKDERMTVEQIAVVKAKQKKDNIKGVRLTRSKAIRAKCMDCMCYQRQEVTLCPSKDCPLWLYRSGKEVDFEGKRVIHKGPNKNTGVIS